VAIEVASSDRPFEEKNSTILSGFIIYFYALPVAIFW